MQKIRFVSCVFAATVSLAAQGIPDFTPPTPLFRAMLGGNIEEVKRVLNEGANPNEGRFINAPPLVLALMLQDSALARVLIDKGADIKASDGTGATTLMWAAAFEVPDMAMVEQLLRTGVDPNAANKTGETALTWALRRGYGVEVEKEIGKSIMSRLHSMYSFGAMAGAGLGGLLVDLRVTAVAHFAFAAPPLLALAFWRAPHMLEVRHAPAAQGKDGLSASKFPTTLIALSAIAFCMLVSEGAMADWIGVYLLQVMNARPGFAGVGFAVFSAAMAVCRFFGDSITHRLGDARTVLVCSLVGAAGLTWALLAPTAAWSLPGFAATGAGFSVVVPIVFGAGGRVENVTPGSGIAAVTGFGYVGFLLGPPAIGFLSEYLSLRHALGMLVGLIIVCALLSGSVHDRRAPSGSPEPAPR